MSPEAPIAELVADRLAERTVGAPPLILGLCGAQGSGKSTVAARLAQRFERSAILSLDDLYLTRAERARVRRGVIGAARGGAREGPHPLSYAKAVQAS